MKAATLRGKLLFYAALAFILPATFLGLSKNGEPLWPAARDLFAPGGALLMLYGALVVGGQARWIGLGADAGPRAGALLAGFGLALLGIGVAEITDAKAWRILAVPGIVVGGLLCLREAWLGKRGALYRGNPGGVERWWLARAGLWMFGLAWPLLVAWAIGVQDLG